MAPIHLILLSVSACNLGLAGFVLWMTRTHRAGRPFAWYLLSIACWTACAGLLQGRFSADALLFFGRGTFFFGAITVCSWLLFCANFPFSSGERFRRIARRITLCSSIWLVLAWTPWIVKDVTADHWWANATMGPLTVPFALWSLCGGVVGIAHLIRKRQRASRREVVQIRAIIFGASSMLLIACALSVVGPLVMSSDKLTYLGPLSSLLVTITSTYAIVRYRLMEIRVILKTGLAYTLTLAVLALVFAVLVPLTERIWLLVVHTPSPFSSFVLVFLLALAFHPAQRWLQHHFSKRFFYRGIYDYRLTLREACDEMAAVRDREHLLLAFAQAVARLVQPGAVAIYLPGHGHELTQVYSLVDWKSLPHTFTPDDPLLLHARQQEDLILTEELLHQRGYVHLLGQRLRAWDVEIALPFVAGGWLHGIVFLGERISDEAYSTDDMAVMRILGTQAAIVLDSDRQYHELVMINEYHERLLQVMQDGVITVDAAGHIITFNPAAERITGVNAGKALGMCPNEIGLAALPTHDIGEQGVEVDIGNDADAERPVRVTITPFHLAGSEEVGRLIVLRDLSAERALEQEKMRAERFSSMGALAASLASEIENPLEPIRRLTGELAQKYDDAHFRDEYSHTVTHKVTQINRLIGQVLDLVRKPTRDYDPIELPEVFQRLLGLVKDDLTNRHITVQTEFPEALSPVMGATGQLYQALMHVLLGAIQSMPQGGTLRIQLASTADRLVCRISDTGLIPTTEELERVFQADAVLCGGARPDLALTYQFVRAHGGEVRAEASPHGLAIIISLVPWPHYDRVLALANSGATTYP